MDTSVCDEMVFSSYAPPGIGAGAAMRSRQGEGRSRTSRDPRPDSTRARRGMKRPTAPSTRSSSGNRLYLRVRVPVFRVPGCQKGLGIKLGSPPSTVWPPHALPASSYHAVSGRRDAQHARRRFQKNWLESAGRNRDALSTDGRWERSAETSVLFGGNGAGGGRVG